MKIFLSWQYGVVCVTPHVSMSGIPSRTVSQPAHLFISFLQESLVTPGLYFQELLNILGSPRFTLHFLSTWIEFWVKFDLMDWQILTLPSCSYLVGDLGFFHLQGLFLWLSVSVGKFKEDTQMSLTEIVAASVGLLPFVAHKHCLCHPVD